jgi:chromosome segregation ATPase
MSDGDAARLQELLRVNAELAAELRALHAGRAAPRIGALPASRRLARLSAELAAAEAERDALRAERDALRAGQEPLQREVARLRGGWSGLLRRLRARFLRS